MEWYEYVKEPFVVLGTIKLIVGIIWLTVRDEREIYYRRGMKMIRSGLCWTLFHAVLLLRFQHKALLFWPLLIDVLVIYRDDFLDRLEEIKEMIARRIHAD